MAKTIMAIQYIMTGNSINLKLEHGDFDFSSLLIKEFSLYCEEGGFRGEITIVKTDLFLEKFCKEYFLLPDERKKVVIHLEVNKPCLLKEKFSISAIFNIFDLGCYENNNEIIEQKIIFKFKEIKTEETINGKSNNSFGN